MGLRSCYEFLTGSGRMDQQDAEPGKLQHSLGISECFNQYYATIVNKLPILAGRQDMKSFGSNAPMLTKCNQCNE